MKTKDAFALQDFDEKRILSRPHFKNFKLPNGDDETILKSFDATKLDRASLMEQKFDELHWLNERTKNYMCFIGAHCRRLRRFFAKYNMADDEQSKIKFERVACLLYYYGLFYNSIDLLQSKIYSLRVKNDKAIQLKCREEFAENLQRLRNERMMTQGMLANRIGISPPSLSQYEHANIEPTIKNLLRLARILDVSVDELLRKAPK